MPLRSLPLYATEMAPVSSDTTTITASLCSDRQPRRVQHHLAMVRMVKPNAFRIHPLGHNGLPGAGEEIVCPHARAGRVHDCGVWHLPVGVAHGIGIGRNDRLHGQRGDPGGGLRVFLRMVWQDHARMRPQGRVEMMGLTKVCIIK